jgi:hypothetical protein
VRVGWFEIAITMLGCIAMCTDVWPRMGGEREWGRGAVVGVGGLCCGRGPQQGGILSGDKEKGGGW